MNENNLLNAHEMRSNSIVWEWFSQIIRTGYSVGKRKRHNKTSQAPTSLPLTTPSLPQSVVFVLSATSDLRQYGPQSISSNKLRNNRYICSLPLSLLLSLLFCFGVHLTFGDAFCSNVKISAQSTENRLVRYLFRCFCQLPPFCWY